MDSSTSNNKSLSDPNVTAETTQTNILNKSFVQNVNSALRSRRTPRSRPPIDEIMKFKLHQIHDLQKAIEEADNEPICYNRADALDTEPDLVTGELDTTLPLAEDSCVSDDQGSFVTNNPNWVLSPTLHVTSKLDEKVFETPHLPLKHTFVTPRCNVQIVKETPSNKNMSTNAETTQNKDNDKTNSANAHSSNNNMTTKAETLQDKKPMEQKPKMVFFNAKSSNKTFLTKVETPQNKQFLHVNPKIISSSAKSNIKDMSTAAETPRNKQLVQLKPKMAFSSAKSSNKDISTKVGTSQNEQLLHLNPKIVSSSDKFSNRDVLTTVETLQNKQLIRAAPHNKQLMELNPKIVFSSAKSSIKSLQHLQTPKQNVATETVSSLANKENVIIQKPATVPTKNLISFPNSNEALNCNKVITVNNKNYMILHELGKGGSSVVYSCYDQEKHQVCAIKRVNLNIDSTMIGGYINEVQMLNKLQSYDRIIRMFDFEIKSASKELLVVLEKGSIDLSRILKNSCAKSAQLPVYRILFYWMEMLYAVKQIHENGIIHSDLKPANFLMAEGHLKLIDFGIASCIQGDNTSVLKDITVGSFNYISPEALQDSKQSTGSPTGHKPKFKINYKSDVWSLGCILYELVYRRTPFHSVGHIYAKLAAILNPKHQINFPHVEGVPESIISAIKMCLRHEPKARPSVDELINLYPYH